MRLKDSQNRLIVDRALLSNKKQEYASKT